MSGQPARSVKAADHSSALPRVPGIPWWGAILLAVTATAVGFAFDAGSGNRELSVFFAICYAAGCLAAVLAVQQAGLFTAVIQPPLLLFLAVPGAYYLFHSGEIAGIKDLAINCGYPLIERFPLMFFTSAIVLIIGLVRWFSKRGTTDDPAAQDDAAQNNEAPDPLAAAATTTMEAVDPSPKRRRREHALSRPSHTAAPDPLDEVGVRPRRTPRPAPGAGSSRSRHTRPPETELEPPVPPTPRPRRRPPVGAQADPAAEPRRRPRTAAPREPRRDLPPVDQRGERRERPLRGERPDRQDRPERSDRGDRAERSPRRRPLGYDVDPYDYPPDRRYGSTHDPLEPWTNGTGGTHHPVSRVRYRGDDDGDSRTEYRARPRRRHAAPDSWDFDG